MVPVGVAGCAHHGGEDTVPYQEVALKLLEECMSALRRLLGGLLQEGWMSRVERAQAQASVPAGGPRVCPLPAGMRMGAGRRRQGFWQARGPMRGLLQVEELGRGSLQVEGLRRGSPQVGGLGQACLRERGWQQELACLAGEQQQVAQGWCCQVLRWMRWALGWM